MAEDEHLTTGWEADVDPADTLLRAAIENEVALVTHAPEHQGGRLLVDERVAAGDLGSPSVFLNAGILRTPVFSAEAEVLGDVDRFFAGDSGGPAVMFSPWPTPDLTSRGWELAGHPPLMFLAPGATAPAPPPDLRIEEVGKGVDAEEFARVLIEGYPLDQLRPYQPGTFFTAASITDPMRAWVGFEGDEPVVAAMGLADDRLAGVHFVATMPTARGKGYGEALTWLATDPLADRPSYLLASDLGRPVYERMGYRSFTRFTLWVLPRGPSSD